MKRIVPAAEDVLRRVSQAACIIGGWLIILLSIGICVEVVLRKVFSTSLQGIDEFGGYALAITASLGMAYCFFEHAHIQIDLVVRKLPTRLGRVFAIIAMIGLGAVVGMIAWEAVKLTQESHMFGAFSNTPLRTPIHYPQGIWAAGFCLFFLAIVLRLIHVLQSILTRDPETTDTLLGRTGSGTAAELTRMKGLE